MSLAVLFILCLVACGGEKDEPSPIPTPAPNPEPEVSEFAMPEANEAVDLGLSVLWASCNFGAKVEGQHGGYFAWGDPTGKLYSADGIGYSESAGGGYTYWNTTNYGGKNPPANISGTTLDVVSRHWGNGWRMPTYEEMRELLLNCEWKVFVNYGIRRCRVTGPNGNSIIMTLSGLLGDLPGDENRFSWPLHVNNSGFYWTATTARVRSQNRGYNVADDIVTSYAMVFSVGKDMEYVDSTNNVQIKYFTDHLRAYHMSIRPVHDK